MPGDNTVITRGKNVAKEHDGFSRHHGPCVNGPYAMMSVHAARSHSYKN